MTYITWEGASLLGGSAATFALRHVLSSTFQRQVRGKCAEAYAREDTDEGLVRVLLKALEAKRVAKEWEGV